MLIMNSSLRFQIHQCRFFVQPMRTRFPFRYGIASLTALPHVFLQVELTVHGGPAGAEALHQGVMGISSEGLPPKWFSKDPHTPVEADLAEMIAVIQNGSRLGRLAAASPVPFQDWWQDFYREQMTWAKHRNLPPLLAGLGVSLLERAVLDALCRGLGSKLHSLLGSTELGLNPSLIRPQQAGVPSTAASALAPLPQKQMAARHTVGLGDPLRATDIPEQERLHDGLPQSLEECIRAYGLRWFKIKACGQPEVDGPRLREIARLLVEVCGADGFRATLDGNEQFESLDAFRDFYQTLQADASLEPLLRQFMFIEQPLHRKHALADSVRTTLESWPDAPPFIIDESDGSLDDLPRALELGYGGTSHKNCKGIVKGLANAALLKSRSHEQTGLPLILSGEDLANVGPVALLQDLAMMAALGVSHVERNGHHYFRGLSMLPLDWQCSVLRHHPGLYVPHSEGGWPTLKIDQGTLDLTSVNAAPFGCALPCSGGSDCLNLESTMQPLDAWIKQGGLSEVSV